MNYRLWSRIKDAAIRCLRLAALGAVASLAQTPGSTVIDITGTVAQPNVKRFGINLGDQNYFDSGQMLKNLIHRNPGFEGMLYQSVVLCSVSASDRCVDGNQYSQWPAGFWDGAEFSVISGPASGRKGTILRSTAPQPTNRGPGAILEFNSSGAIVRKNDALIVRKKFPGDPQAGWWTEGGGGSISAERSDLAPGTAGQQAIRLTVPSTGQSLRLISYFDTTENHTFVRMNGAYRLSFKAKGAGGRRSVTVSVARLHAGVRTYLDRTVTLDSGWNNYQLDFAAHEDAPLAGPVRVMFAVSGSDVLLDDVSLVRSGGRGTNPTAFRDEVVAALKTLRPGVLRYMSSATGLGDSLDNMIAPPDARLRPGYSAWKNRQEDTGFGLHEFLELAEAIGAEPWIVVPITFSEDEIEKLIEYLAGSRESVYGGRRAARGHLHPWTASFSQIHLEFGNEAWNGLFKGASLELPEIYGARGSQIFQAARGAAGFDRRKFNLVLGGQSSWPGRSEEQFKFSDQHDTLTVAPYLYSKVDQYRTIEDLFGPLLAEPQLLVGSGTMRQNYNVARRANPPARLAVYEVNLHTTEGEIAQDALDQLAPSAGAGVAVADHMLLMLRDLGVREQMLFSLPQFGFQRSDGKSVRLWGSVVDMGQTFRKRPQYLALQMINEAIKGNLLQTVHSGVRPVWRQPKVNEVALDAADYLHSFAFAEGPRRSLVLINLHRTDEVPVSLRGANAPTGEVAIRQLAAAAITDNNEFEERVKISDSTAVFAPQPALTLAPFSITVLHWAVPVTANTPDRGQPTNGTGRASKSKGVSPAR